MSLTAPARTGAPTLVDSNVANTIDFHVAATNFIKVIDAYLNEVATSYAHNHSLSTHDPITAEANFFKQLNEGELNLTGKEAGSNANVKGSLTVKVDTNLSSSEIWKTDVSGAVESRLNNGVTEYMAIDTKTSTTRWIPAEEDVLSQVKEKVSQLSSAYGESQMNEEFVLYWIEKFRTAHSAVKEAYQEMVTDSTDDVFTEFSDSMGLLTRISENIDTTLIPLWDVEMDKTDLIPRPYNAILDDKLDNNTKILLFEMSLKNNALFRNSLSQILNVAAVATTTHGENLVTDDKHYKRILNIADELNGYVADVLGKVARVMFYIRTITTLNSQSSTNYSYTAAIENTLLKIDALKNKVQELQSTRTTQSSLSAVPM